MKTTTLLSTRIHPSIEALDFSRIKHKLMVNDEGDMWTYEQCELAEREYKRFLTLIKLNPKRQIVPTKLMDKFWHQHILDTAAYYRDCMETFGFFIHHFPYFGIYGTEDKEKLDLAFEDSKQLYYQCFGEEMQNPVASRCEDHACHVESECACRVAGACKNC